MDLSIVVPCYNEIESLPRIEHELFPVVSELAARYVLEVIFVDDGSTDGTGPALAEVCRRGLGASDLRVEYHQVNRGLGAAVRTGFAAARGRIVVTTDSDATYRFPEIVPLLARLTADVDVVTASAYHPAGRVIGVPAYRLLLSRGSSLIYRLLVDWRVHTYTCLFRAYRRAVIEQVPFGSDGYLAGTELLVKAMLLGYRVGEHPAVLHSRAAGVSKAKLFRTTLAHLRFQGRVLLHRLKITPLVQADQAV